MATNKNALIRYQVLDRCFSNSGRMFFWQDLLKECNHALMEHDPNNEGIKRRQLFDDIKFMESEAGWSIPLNRIRHGKKLYYRYDDPKFSINNQPLNDTEAEQVKAALQIVSRFSGTPQFDWVQEIIPKLETKFGLIKHKTQIVGHEENRDLTGLHHFRPLFNAIVNERVLLVQYKDFKSEAPYTITFHPYYLKQYNSRWFVFGLNPEKEIPTWNLALDRIASFSETNQSYIPTDINWSDYFDDIVGVTKPDGGTPEQIKLFFTKAMAPYVLTKPLHPYQKQDLEPDGLSVRLEVIPNFELERLILSFGEQVKVISPGSLKNRIAERLKKAQELY
jgi:predicted DNA-binding transcriptional regulator YafY